MASNKGISFGFCVPSTGGSLLVLATKRDGWIPGYVVTRLRFRSNCLVCSDPFISGERLIAEVIEAPEATGRGDIITYTIVPSESDAA